MDDFDEDLELDVGDGHEPITPYALLRECEDIAAGYQDGSHRLDLALRNERWVHGDQFSDEEFLDEDHAVAWDDKLPPQSRNLLRSYWLTWTARALEEMPITMCYPDDSSGIDVTLAAIANKLLDYADRKNNATGMWQQQIGIMQMHTTAAFKVCFDPTRDVHGGVGPGDVVHDPHTIFDYFQDDCDQDEDARWCVYRRWVPYDQALAMALAAGISIDDFEIAATSERSKTKRTDSGGDEKRRKLVAISELWWKPEGEFGRFPVGLKIDYLGKLTLDAKPFPYDHGELPLATVKVNWVRGSPYGSTHVDDAISPQRAYNEAVSVQMRRAWEFRNTYGVAKHSVIEKLNDGDLWIGVGEDVDPDKVIAFVSPPGPSEMLQHEEDRARVQIGDAFGLNETMTGNAEIAGRGPAGKTVSYLKWMNSQKFKDTIENIHKALRRISRQTIRLFQQYGSDELILSIIGRDRVVDLAIFREADLSNIDAAIVLEPAVGASRLRAAQAEAALLASQNGQMDPMRAAEVQRTGLAETSGDNRAANDLQALVQRALSGEPVQPDPTIDPGFAAGELDRLFDAYRGHPNAGIILEISSWYRSQAGAAMPPQGGATPPPVGGSPIPGGVVMPQGVGGGPPLE